jgi:hypothetical protein
MTIYYVDPVSGSNSNAGTSFGAAFATTAKAASVVAAGDSVCLCATGTEILTSTNTISFSTSGTAAANIVWQGYNATGTAALAAGSYYTITGASMSASTDMVASAGVQFNTFYNVFFTTAKRNIIGTTNDSAYTTQFIRCSFSAPTTNMVAVTSGTNGIGIMFVNCVMTGSGASGTQILIYGTSNRDGCIFLGCTISAFNSVLGASGVGAGNGTEQYIGNVFANNGTVVAPNLYSGAAEFSGNVFYGNTTAICICDRSSTARNYFITNNSFVNNTTVFLAAASNNTFGLEFANHFYNNTTIYNGAALVSNGGTVTGNPLFNAPGSLDFRLQSGSPLINAGLNGQNIAGLPQIPGGGSVQYSRIYGG